MSHLKFVRNDSGSAMILPDVGLEIANGATYQVEPQDYLLWSASATDGDAEPVVLSGDLVVIFETTDLDPTDGLCYLRVGQEMLAKAVCYNNTLTGLPPNVQDAIDSLGDPFASALFDTDCEPLFDKGEDGSVELLLECGSD